MVTTNDNTSVLPVIQSEIDAICKDLNLSVDHLNHGDLDAMYAGIRGVASGQQLQLLALTPDTWAFGVAVSSPKPVRMESTIVDADGWRLAPEMSLSSVQALGQLPTSMMSSAAAPMLASTTVRYNDDGLTSFVPTSASAKKPGAQENTTSSATPMQQAPMTLLPSGFATWNPRCVGTWQPAGVTQHASHLQLSLNCPDLAEGCEVVCLATARLQDGDRFLAKSTFFVALAGATPFSWKFTSVPFNLPVAHPVCHVKLRHVPLSAADVIEKMDRLVELLGQEEYEWRLMALKQEFAVKGIVPHPSRR